ncbi:MAG: mucoidy inhibitor MuiA family protein [Candidatus Thorarchaeota archaeon]|nr:mucoidy inhibitor MuiA family protein [Candidatus Thorarchaeota archaeon]
MKEINTQISTVTVFRDGARIVRIGKTELTAGEQTVKVPGITRYAEPESFRVKGKGNAVLRGIDVKQISQTYEPEGDVKELHDNLKALEKERAVIDDKILLQRTRGERLNVVMSQFSSEFGKWYSVGETSMDQMTKMDKTGSDLILDSKRAIRDLETDLERIQTESAALHDNINRIQGQRRTETFNEVFVSLDVKESTPLELEVTYQLRMASWQPTYDVDIGEEKSSVKRIAVVQNQTLEDWEDVGLTVSTASAQPVEAVEPNPFYVDVYTPQHFGMVATRSAAAPRKMKKEKGYAEDEELDDLMMEAAEETMPDIIEDYTEPTETLGGITVYSVPGEVSIPADNDPHPVTLTLEEFDSRRLHYWNAAAMAEVVAQDEITNGDAVLLPGNVKVYAAGDFIGETYLSLQAPREKFRLGTRVAYDVKAEKKLIEKDTEKAGITRGKQKRGYKYSLEIQSFAKREITVKVVDVIPYSNSEKITVELPEPTLPFKKMELGVIEWETKMGAGTETKIGYSYEVEWEKDVTIRPPLP